MKGKKAKEAMNVLKFVPQKSAYFARKLLGSGIAAAESKNADSDKLYIKTFRVDRAQVTKRIQIKSKGAADEIQKRRSHLTLILEDKESKESFDSASHFAKASRDGQDRGDKTQTTEPKAGKPELKKGSQNGSKS